MKKLGNERFGVVFVLHSYFTLYALPWIYKSACLYRDKDIQIKMNHQFPFKTYVQLSLYGRCIEFTGENGSPGSP